MTAQPDDRLSRLIGYLQADPFNTQLLTDAVEAALAAGNLPSAEALNARLREAAPAGFEGQYLAGMIAMRQADFAQAAAIFAPLLANNDHANLRFNLAWSKAMIGDKPAALTLLDGKTVKAIPAAAMLQVQLLHEAGEFEAAWAVGQAALQSHPADIGLLAAMATLAMDLDDPAAARDYAARAGDHPEALAASALLVLQDGAAADAHRLFTRSLAIREHNPRAWIGLGLAALAQQDPAEAARAIDRGAQQFGDHIGSWIAAGWAHFIAGDPAAARQRFERALAIDDSFAESQGSLAVVEILAGDRDAGRKRALTAQRLDRECFSAALAQSLLSEDPGLAQAIVDQAMQVPINDRGLTLASYLSGLTRPTVH